MPLRVCDLDFVMSREKLAIMQTSKYTNIDILFIRGPFHMTSNLRHTISASACFSGERGNT